MSFSPFSIRNMSHMIPCDYWLFLTDLLLTLLAIAFYVKLSLLLLLLSFVQVSRRFDSRKFRVRFSAQKCAGNTDDVGRLGEVRTTPIEVFSKRKIKKVSTPQDSNPRKRRRMNHAKASDLDALEAKYAPIFDDIRATLEQQVCVSLSLCVCVGVCVYPWNCFANKLVLLLLLVVVQQKAINHLVATLHSRTITRSHHIMRDEWNNTTSAINMNYSDAHTCYRRKQFGHRWSERHCPAASIRNREICGYRGRFRLRSSHTDRHSGADKLQLDWSRISRTMIDRHLMNIWFNMIRPSVIIIIFTVLYRIYGGRS